jgi:hypothetical protein
MREMLAPKSKMCATAVNRIGGLEEDLYLALYKERLLSHEAKRLMAATVLELVVQTNSLAIKA